MCAKKRLIKSGSMSILLAMLFVLLSFSAVFADDGAGTGDAGGNQGNPTAFSRDFSLNAGDTIGFLIYADKNLGQPTVRLEDGSLGRVSIVNPNDNRGYYCELYVTKAGNTNIIATLNGVSISKPVNVTGPNLSLSKELNIKAGESSGFLLCSDNRKSLPSVSVGNSDVAYVKLVNSRDERGYYYEIIGKKSGTTDVTFVLQGTALTKQINVEGPVIGISKNLSVTSGSTIGFIITSNNRNGVPSITLADASMATVKVVNTRDGIGYYCELTGLKPGDTKAIISLLGNQIEADVGITGPELSINKDLNLKAGETTGFILQSNVRNGLPSFFVEGGAAVVKVVKPYDSRGYYCEITALKSGNFLLKASLFGTVLEKNINVAEPELAINREFDLKTGQTAGFIIESNNRNGMPQFQLSDRTAGIVRVVNPKDRRGYYCEYTALKAGNFTLGVNLFGKVYEKAVAVENAGVSVSRDLNFCTRDVNGFIIRTETKYGIPKVYSQHDEIAAVRVVDATDSRGYYCDIRGMSAGTTNLVINYLGNWVTVPIDIINVSREVFGIKDSSYGVTISAKDVGGIQNVYTTDDYVARVGTDYGNGRYSLLTNHVGRTTLVVVKNGKKFYKDITVLEDRDVFDPDQITIDIATQRLSYYKNYSLVFEASVVTGNKHTGMSTPKGTYRVNSKSRNTRLVGQDYSITVDYWIGFIGNMYGIHSAHWRNSFGGNIYLYNGSHGCVNMSVSDAARLFSMVRIGTIIHIK